jgi:predicted peptidase
MKNTLPLVLLLSASALISRAAMESESPAAGTLAPAKLEWQITRKAEIQYLLYLPKDYDAKSGKTWPLMLFLHGAGERGTNLQLVAIHGPPKLAKQGKELPFILVAPQCPEDQRWDNDALLQLLDHVMKQHAVDRSRVYLTGLSMGGYGTWSLGVQHPEKFAALVPVCGGGERIDVLLAGGKRAAALKNTPIWAFHGAKDPVVPLDESQRMVDALKRLGAKDVKLTVYPEAGHDAWTETYNNPELYDWLSKQHRASAEAGK